VAHGSDGGGSIRIPASLCGLVGLKPSRGRISYAPLGEGWAGMSTQGPLCHTVQDAALFLDAIAGPALGDFYWAAPPPHTFREAARREPGRLRIGWATRTSEGKAEPEIAEATRRAVTALEGLGHAVEEAAFDADRMWEPFWQIASASLAARAIPDPDLLEPHARATLERGRQLSAADYVNAVTALHQHARRLVTALDRYDALVTPTLPRTAPPLGALGADPRTSAEEIHDFIPFTYAFNMTGQPAVSLPLAQSASGLPIGVQVVGRPADDGGILALAAQLEQALPWRQRRPALA
jgi:amidase